MKSFNIQILLAIAVVIALFTIHTPVSAQQHYVWHRAGSTMQSDSLYAMNDSTAPEGNYFIRFQFSGTSPADTAAWTLTGLDVPFSGLFHFRARPKDPSCSYIAGIHFRLTLYDHTVSETQSTVDLCDPGNDYYWHYWTFSGGYPNITQIDSMKITVGYYVASEVLPPAWWDFDAFGAGATGDSLFYDGGELGSIQGTVWFDQNQDQAQSQNETGLSNWQVKLSRDSTYQDSTTTDAQGHYQFPRLERGAYAVTVTAHPGFTQTTPDSLTTTITVGETLDHTLNWGEFCSNTTLMNVRKRWNIVSLPRAVPDGSVGTIFPTATSNAFSYAGTYHQEDTLKPGLGYWLKFGADQQISIVGDSTATDTVSVAEGWNLIGSLTTTLPAAFITSIPPSMTTSQLFGYNGGYTVADTVEPGKGYWIKVTQTGQLVLSTTTPPSSLAKTGGFIQRLLSDTPPPPPEAEAKAAPHLPAAFALQQNYPNPFNPVTTIEYGVQSTELVSLKVYNVLGQDVAILVSEVQPAGSYTVTWNAGSRPSGIYYYMIQVGSYRESKKMLLMK